MNDVYLNIFIDPKEKEDNKYHKYSKGFFISNIYDNNSNCYKEYGRCNIPIKKKELASIESYDNYDETTYILLKFEILEFNDCIDLYLKRINKGYSIPNLNLEKNIARKYLYIKKLELAMR